jgi:hypothetical protein
MPNDGKRETEKNRRPYSPPQVREYPLRLEEVVLGGCKNSSMPGPLVGQCTTTSCQADLS